MKYGKKIILLTMSFLFLSNSLFNKIVSAKENQSTGTPTSNNIEASITPGSNAFCLVNNDNEYTINSQNSDTDNIEYDYDMAEDLLKIINDERENNSLEPLALDLELSKIADYRTYDMLKNDYFSHTQNDDNKTVAVSYLADEFNYKYNNLGENIALCYLKYYSAKTFFDCWCGDEEHKSLMLNPVYTNAGVSIARLKDDNNQYKIIAVLNVSKPAENNQISQSVNNTKSTDTDLKETYDSNKVFIYIAALIASSFCFIKKFKN